MNLSCVKVAFKQVPVQVKLVFAEVERSRQRSLHNRLPSADHRQKGQRDARFRRQTSDDATRSRNRPGSCENRALVEPARKPLLDDRVNAGIRGARGMLWYDDLRASWLPVPSNPGGAWYCEGLTSGCASPASPPYAIANSSLYVSVDGCRSRAQRSLPPGPRDQVIVVLRKHTVRRPRIANSYSSSH
jgi:hypothetical protein